MVVKREIVSKNKAKRSTIINAYILLKADRTCGWTNIDIAGAYEVSTKKVEQLKKRFVEEGFEAALYRKSVTNAFTTGHFSNTETYRLTH